MKTTTTIFLALLAAFPAFAQDAQPAAPAMQQPTSIPPTMTAREMVEQARDSFLSPRERAFASEEEEMLRQIRLAQMQLELSELRRKIQEASNPTSVRPPDSVNRPAMDAPVIDAPARDPFTLVSVWGDEQGLRADLAIGGLRVTVRQGSTLSDGWRVTRVAENAVDLVRGSERRTLRLGGAQ